jgi:hypothetical protein
MSLIIGVGVSALLDQLFHAILDEQDGVLLLSPYYAGFDRDLVVGRSKVSLIGVECPLSEGSEDRWDGRGGLGEVFEKAYQDAKGRGVNVRHTKGSTGTTKGAIAHLILRLGFAGPSDVDHEPPQPFGNHRVPLHPSWVL